MWQGPPAPTRGTEAQAKNRHLQLTCPVPSGLFVSHKRGDLYLPTSAHPTTNDPSVLPRAKRPSVVSYGSISINLFLAPRSRTEPGEWQASFPQRTWHGPYLPLCLPPWAPAASPSPQQATGAFIDSYPSLKSEWPFPSLIPPLSTNSPTSRNALPTLCRAMWV